MKKLLYKELKLFSSPMNILFLCLLLMLFIPSYPYYVAIFYVFMGLYFSFLFGRENKDLVYMSMLPIPKKDIVKSKYLFMIFYEIVAVIIMIPIIYLRCTVANYDNKAGINANIAFIGLSLIMMCIYNLAFFRSYFKKPEKVGTAFIKGCIAITMYYFLADGVTLYAKNVLHSCFWNSLSGKDLIMQIPILVVGIVIYIIGMSIGYRCDVKNFEQINV